MKSKPLVSVIIPVYNVEKYLSESLKGIVKQKYHNFECIIVDDGSTDGTRDILKKIKKQDSRIKVISQSNSGVAAARNRGFKEAKGDYVIFLDADDVYSRRLLSSVNKTLKKHKYQIDIVIYNYTTLDMDTGYKHYSLIPFSSAEVFSAQDYKDTIFQIFPHIVWNRVFRRDFLLKNNIVFDESMRVGEDSLFVDRALVLAEKIIFLDCDLVSYRHGHSDSTMSNRHKFSPKEVFWQGKLGDILRRENLYDVFERSFLNLALSDSIYILNGIEASVDSEKFLAYCSERVIKECHLFNKPCAYFYSKDNYNAMKALSEDNYVGYYRFRIVEYKEGLNALKRKCENTAMFRFKQFVLSVMGFQKVHAVKSLLLKLKILHIKESEYEKFLKKK
jgi:glycosyltransferase involved in cell wall biosynthesis